MDQGVHYLEAYHSDSRHHSWTGIRLRLPKWVDKVTLHSLPVLSLCSQQESSMSREAISKCISGQTSEAWKHNITSNIFPLSDIYIPNLDPSGDGP